jgi:hypothetical protein
MATRGRKPGASPKTLGPKCGAAGKDGPCRNGAGERTDHLGTGRCYRHGGATPTHQINAEKTMAEQALQEALTTFGLEVETTAEDALMGALMRAHGTVLFYRSRVRALTDDQMVYGTRRITRTVRPAGPNGPAGATQMIEDVTVAETTVNVWVRLLEGAEKHLLAVASQVAALDIEQRRVKIAEEQGAFIFEATARILAKMGISEDDPRLPLVVGEVLEELSA